MPGELLKLLIYFVVLFIAYCIWIKIKAHFTERTFSQQANHEQAKKEHEVCRNCEFCLGPYTCEIHGNNIDYNRTVCDLFVNKNP